MAGRDGGALASPPIPPRERERASERYRACASTMRPTSQRDLQARLDNARPLAVPGLRLLNCFYSPSVARGPNVTLRGLRQVLWPYGRAYAPTGHLRDTADTPKREGEGENGGERECARAREY